MNVETFLANFDRLAEAPNGIPKLRELILQLAVRGKLVPQDPEDEPASELLKKIQAEKQRLIAEGTIRKTTQLSPVGESEILYEIPASWMHVKLGDWGDWGAGATPNRRESEYYGGTMPWFKSGELRDCECLTESQELVTERALAECSLRTDKPGDVLIAMYGATIGRLAILGVEATTNQAVCACTCFTDVFNQYLFLLLRSYRLRFTAKGSGGAQPNISKVKIVGTPAPMPPLAEQKRIVAKVDELMALCDDLETKQQAKRAKRIALNRASLHELTEPNETSLATAWHRVRDHFDDLYTVPETVAQLRQTILQVAVMGRLVPQDPNDEPASELLKKIQAEKQRLIAEGRIRKPKPLPPIGSDEAADKLPRGWEWTRLDKLCSKITDGAHHTPTYIPSGVAFLSVKDVSSGWLDFSSTKFISREEHEELSARCSPQLGDILLTKVGTTGIAVAVDTDREFSLFVSVALLKPIRNKVDVDWLTRVLNSPLLKQQSEAQTMGVGNKNLVLKFIRAFTLPLPPLAEQKRIVAKADQLMVLCDDLETKLNQAQQNVDHCLASIVYELIA